MLLVFNRGCFTGTSYPSDDQDARAHHASQGEICVWIPDGPALAIGDTLPNLSALVQEEKAEAERAAAIDRMATIDAATVRPLRAVLTAQASGTAPAQEDMDKLAALESEAVSIREAYALETTRPDDELAGLGAS